MPVLSLLSLLLVGYSARLDGVATTIHSFSAKQEEEERQRQDLQEEVVDLQNEVSTPPEFFFQVFGQRAAVCSAVMCSVCPERPRTTIEGKTATLLTLIAHPLSALPPPQYRHC